MSKVTGRYIARLVTGAKPVTRETPRRPHLFGIVAAAALLLAGMAGSHPARSEVPLAADQIGGTVKSARGAEAGGWVIAETDDFPTRSAMPRRGEAQERRILSRQEADA